MGKGRKDRKRTINSVSLSYDNLSALARSGRLRVFQENGVCLKQRT